MTLLGDVLENVGREPLRYAAWTVIAVLVTIASSMVYSIYLSPLSKFPGPKLSAASNLPYLYSVLTGTTREYVCDMHTKYGDVVRISPRELSYTHPQAWKDINGFRHGKTLPEKEHAFYVNPPNGVPSLFSAKNDYQPRLRKPLAHAFSEKAVRDAEPLVQVYVDKLMNGLREVGAKNGVVDFGAWMNWTTFDIIGDLSFGEPFDCLDNHEYHPWVKIIFDMVRATAMMGAMRRYPGFQTFIELVLPASKKELQFRHQRMTDERVQKRLNTVTERPDFVTALQRNKDKQDALNDDELSSGMFATIVAGSETSATVLSSVYYFLSKNPDKRAKLLDAVRGAFSSEDEINMHTAAKVPYVRAVLDETMRVYPPVPNNMPREIRKGGLEVLGEWLPEGTICSVHQYASFHSPKYWRDPETYAPERWLGDPRYKDDERAIFQPFSIGPRNCIGMTLAYAELQLLLTKLAYNFDIEMPDPEFDWLKGQKTYMIWERGPLKMKIANAQPVGA